MSEHSRGVAVVTGASSGIGAATARVLAAEGFLVWCAARRADRVARLADAIGGRAIACDIKLQDDVDALAAAVGDRLDVLVNNAGGALGKEPLADADMQDWRTMFETNVVGTARVTQALLPAIRAARGTIVMVTSGAAESAYEGGAGYCAAKSGERAMTAALRLELNGEPVRVCEIAPGLVHTEEFSLTRFRGDQAQADAAYAGVPGPLVAEDIAECIRWTVSLPAHVNIDRLLVRPLAQAANHKLFRGSF